MNSPVMKSRDISSIPSGVNRLFVQRVPPCSHLVAEVIGYHPVADMLVQVSQWIILTTFFSKQQNGRLTPKTQKTSFACNIKMKWVLPDFSL